MRPGVLGEGKLKKKLDRFKQWSSKSRARARFPGGGRKEELGEEGKARGGGKSWGRREKKGEGG